MVGLVSRGRCCDQQRERCQQDAQRHGRLSDERFEEPCARLARAIGRLLRFFRGRLARCKPYACVGRAGDSIGVRVPKRRLSCSAGRSTRNQLAAASANASTLAHTTLCNGGARRKRLHDLRRRPSVQIQPIRQIVMRELRRHRREGKPQRTVRDQREVGRREPRRTTQQRRDDQQRHDRHPRQPDVRTPQPRRRAGDEERDAPQVVQQPIRQRRAPQRKPDHAAEHEQPGRRGNASPSAHRRATHRATTDTGALRPARSTANR